MKKFGSGFFSVSGPIASPAVMQSAPAAPAPSNAADIFIGPAVA